jgi:hypothetical protein
MNLNKNQNENYSFIVEKFSNEKLIHQYKVEQLLFIIDLEKSF